MPLGIKVRLVSRPGAIGSGLLRDVSLSGAFVQTDLKLPLLTRVVIDVASDELGLNEARDIPACVVRQDDGGIGVEWYEFASQKLCELLAESLARDTTHLQPSHPLSSTG